MNGYEWDGKRWVLQSAGTRPGTEWAPPSATGAPALGPQFPALTGGAFTEARYGYGLTRQASDDIQFIARYLKIVIILGLVLLATLLVSSFVSILGMLGLIGSISTHR